MTNTNEEVPEVIITNVIDQFGSIEIYTDYSGRGMYGATCFGLVFSDPGEKYAFFVELGAEVARSVERDEDVYYDLAGDLARAAREDSMGRDTIMYFPGYELA